MTAIWQATLADRRLQALEKDDCEYLASLLGGALQPFTDDCQDEIESFSRLAFTLIGAAVHHTITLDEPEAKRVLARFKAMLPDRFVLR